MTTTHGELADLARLCASNAHLATSKAVALTLWKMAVEYRTRALAIDSTKQVNIGKPPLLLHE